MGIFGFGKKKTEQSSAQTNNGSQALKLTKSKEDLSNVVLKLTKDTGIDLSTMKARVVVVMDDSGSMDWQYRNGNVQDILTRLLPFGLAFDDNGEVDVYLFSDSCKKIEPSMTEENYENYVKLHIDHQHNYGGTAYAPAITMTDMDFNDAVSAKVPTLVFFITDGENFDEGATNVAIRNSSEHGIFYMFIGSGNESFYYLKKLDDLEGRKIDNTGFMQVSDFNSVSNTELFLKSLKDYIPWLKEKGYLNK